MDKIRVGFAMTGSFCVFSKVIPEMEALVKSGYDVTAVMSETAFGTDTRFGRAEDHIKRITEITGKPIIHTIPAAEPVGPKGIFDIVVVAPCTGNTLGKLACGITDTAVTMAVKGHLRNRRPVVLAVSTNDALGASGRNIGTLFNTRNIYFVPMRQDDPKSKETSIVADFTKIHDAAAAALEGRQLQPVFC